MKLLCICDAAINRTTVPELEELSGLGIETVIYDNPMLDDMDKVMKCMHETEHAGPEGYPYPEELKDLVKDIDILMVHVTPITKELLEGAPNLKLVAIMRGGCNNVDLACLKEKGAAVVNAAWRSANAVADFAVGMMLAEVKNIAKSHAGLMAGKWIKEYPNEGHVHDLQTRTVGIIGFGQIGQRVAQRLKGFEAKIIVHDPYMPDEVIESLGYRAVSKEELCKEADIITLHLRLSESTEKFISREDIASMKKTALFVNTARAGLVDEEALVEALAANRIQGAALDVFNEEPLSPENPILKLNNVTLTAHIAGVSSDTSVNSFRIVFEDIQRYLNQENMKCVVRL